MKSGPRALVFPAWNYNAYLNLLQLAPRAAGYQFAGALTAFELVNGIDSLGSGDIVHVHWTTPLLQQATSEREAAKRLRHLERALRLASVRGVRIIWTVHNRMPHEVQYPVLEKRLMNLLAARAHAIHIMAPHTAEAVSDIAHLSSMKIVEIPHPTYDGIYDTGITREAARASFDLEPSDLAVLFLGQIRPYKGVDALVRAAADAEHPNRRIVLLLAGDVREMSDRDLTALVPDDLATRTQLTFVDDGEIARWMRAADLAVFPYRAVLNSGSVHLAATFDVPALLPDEPHLRRQFADEHWLSFFDPADAAASIAQQLSDERLFAEVHAGDFASFRARSSPWQISTRYLALLDQLSAQATAA